MEQDKPDEGNSAPVKHDTEQIVKVYTLRDWKEYVGESFLIIFSVLLALILTEFISSLHEKSETRELLENVKKELITNKQFETEQLAYHLKVLKSIDSALTDPERQKKIVVNDEFHLHYIAPADILYRYFDDVAWEVAKNHNISSKISLNALKKLTHIYLDQARIMKVEDEIAKVLLSYESRKTQNAHETLILLRDNYKGWAVDRAPGLLLQYDEAFKLLDEK
jgi:hypothetical protein